MLSESKNELELLSSTLIAIPKKARVEQSRTLAFGSRRLDDALNGNFAHPSWERVEIALP